MFAGAAFAVGDLVAVGVFVLGIVVLSCSGSAVSICRYTVAVKVGVVVLVGMKSVSNAFVGDEVAKTRIVSKGGNSNIPAVKVSTVSTNSTEANTLVVSSNPARFFTGTRKVSSNNEDRIAASL